MSKNKNIAHHLQQLLLVRKVCNHDVHASVFHCSITPNHTSQLLCITSEAFCDNTASKGHIPKNHDFSRSSDKCAVPSSHNLQQRRRLFCSDKTMVMSMPSLLSSKHLTKQRHGTTATMQLRYFARQKNREGILARQKKKREMEKEEEEYYENEREPTVTELIFGWSVKEEEEEDRRRYLEELNEKAEEGTTYVWFKDLPISGKIWYVRETSKEAIRQYLWTWKDFWKHSSDLTEEDFIYRTKKEEEALARQKSLTTTTNAGEEKKGGDYDDLINATEKTLDNVERNVNFIKDEAKQITGISSSDDAKRWLGEQMKVAIECLSSFMQGYRKARDEEREKMLNTYFQELEEKVDQNMINKVGEKSDESEELVNRKRRRRKIRSIKYNY